MLSKANAKIELFSVVPPEALIFSLIERAFVWNILKQFLSFLYVLTFRHKSRKTPPSSCGTITLKHLLRP